MTVRRDIRRIDRLWSQRSSSHPDTGTPTVSLPPLKPPRYKAPMKKTPPTALSPTVAELPTVTPLYDDGVPIYVTTIHTKYVHPT